MGQSGVKALPSPRSFKPPWSSDGKINTTRGKRGLELPPIRQGISSGASAVSNDGLQNHWRNFKIQTGLALATGEARRKKRLSLGCSRIARVPVAGSYNWLIAAGIGDMLLAMAPRPTTRSLCYWCARSPRRENLKWGMSKNG